ncbi:MAG: deoxyribonuclease IV [Bacilli bacterium]|nr:deoxyribonuclease IV [Bacilli bacterium]
MSKLYIGSHVGLNAPDFYLGSVREALSYGATTFMFYTGAPQNSFRKPLDQLKVEEGRKLIKESGLDESKIIVHAPYIINACNITKPDLYEMSINFIVNELQRTAGFGVSIMVLHPGAHVGQGREIAIDALVKALDEALDRDGTNVKIALETMAGKGTEVGVTFEEIAQIINLSKHKERLGVCFDTCHTHDSGYDLSDFDAVLDEFDRIIGLDRLLVVHLNDSKNIRGAHKDRHENIGYGEIGFDILYKVVTSPRLENIPIILETPYYNEKPPYKQEIEMLRSGKFDPLWRDKL